MRYLLPTAEVYKDLFVDFFSLSSDCRRMAMATAPRRATQQRRQLLARRTHHHHAGTDLLPFLVRGCPLMLLLMWSGYSLYFFMWTTTNTNHDYIKNGVIHAYRKGMIEKSSIMSTNKKYFNHTVSVFHPTEW